MHLPQSYIIHSSTFLFSTCHPFKIQFILLFVHSSAYTSIKRPTHPLSYSSHFPIHLLLHLSSLSYPSTLPYPLTLSSVYACMHPSTLLSIHCPINLHSSIYPSSSYSLIPSSLPSISLLSVPSSIHYPIYPTIHISASLHPSLPSRQSHPPSGHLNVQNWSHTLPCIRCWGGHCWSKSDLTLSSRTLNTVGKAVMITEDCGRRGNSDTLLEYFWRRGSIWWVL